MCVRYACSFSANEIEHEFGVPSINAERQSPRTNVAPRTYNPVMHLVENQCTLDYMEWGLLPDTNLSAYNCRMESLEDLRPIWKCAKTKRGAAVMNGYFEWQYKALDRIPYFFYAKSSKITMALAIWQDKSFSIVTKPASERASKVHPRMPILVDFETAQKWMEGEWPAVLKLVNTGIEPEYYRVSQKVNKVQNQGPDLLKKVAVLDLGAWAKKPDSEKQNKRIINCKSEAQEEKSSLETKNPHSDSSSGKETDYEDFLSKRPKKR